MGAGGLTLAASLVSGSSAAASAHQAVTVNSLADRATPTSVVGKHETLADAIEHLDTITGGGTIEFASWLTGTIKLSHALPEITQPITIDGPGEHRLMVDGGGSHGLRYPVMTVTTLNGGTTTVKGLTLADGYASKYGGAVRAVTPLEIVNSTLRDNRAGDKGGAIFTESSLRIVNSTIRGNRSAHWDGGIAAKHSSGAHVVIDRSTFSGNRAIGAADGAMYLGSPTLIEDSTIADNSSAQYGAGLGFYAGTSVTIVGSTISGNTVTGRPSSSGDPARYAGGGIGEWRSSPSAHTELGIYDSIIAGNNDRVGTGEDVSVANEQQYGAPQAVFSLVGQTTGSGIAQDRRHDDILGTHARPARVRLGKLGLHGGSTATLVPELGAPTFAAGDQGLFAAGALPFGTRHDQRGVRRTAGVSLIGGDGTDIGAVETPKRTRAVVAGDREFAMTTVGAQVSVSRGVRLPVLYTTVKLRHRHLRLRFERLAVTLSGSPAVHVYHRQRGQIALPLRHLHPGRHRLTAVVRFASGHGHHTRTGDVRVRFTVRLR